MRWHGFGKSLQIVHEACGWCKVHGGMAGKSLVGGCVGVVLYEACGWYMIHGGMADKSLGWVYCQYGVV